MATACSDDLGQQPEPTKAGKGHVVEVGATLAPATRMTVEDANSMLNYYWTADDAFTVFDVKNGQQTLFSINADSLAEKSSVASFTGEPELAYEEGQTLYAVYNKNSAAGVPLTLDENGNLTLDLSNQTGELNENYQFLWGEATYNENQPVRFNFQHLVTTLRLEITVPEGVTELKQIQLLGEGLVPHATLVLNKAPYDSESRFNIGDLVYSYTDNSEDARGSITLNGSFVPTNGVVTVYVYALAAKRYHDNVTWADTPNIQPMIVITDTQDNEFAVTNFFGMRKIEKGTAYAIKTDSTLPMVDFANEASVTGGVNDPYEIANADQLYSFMMRTYTNRQNRQAQYYKELNYKLTDDIVLDNRSLWYPIRLDGVRNYSTGVTFDGNGKTISGEITYNVNGGTGLFGTVYRTNIKELTLDADIALESHNSTWWTDTGSIVANLYNGSSVYHCFNKSRLNCGTSVQRNIGGIIGSCNYSTISYCGNTGTIITDLNQITIGGIVGSLENTSSVEGCYSNGSVICTNVVYFDQYAGGVVGQLTGSNPTIKHCWSATSFVISEKEEADGDIFYKGGLVGNGQTGTITNCYWSNVVESAIGTSSEATIATIEACAPFEGTIPTAEQLQKLNEGILASGYQFSTTDGTLVKNDKTIVPPSDIEKW